MGAAVTRTEAGNRSCIFCGIAMGGVESHIVFEDEYSTAFLDSRPLFLGHCLLIPKQHHETLSDLPRDLVGPLFTNVQLIAAAVEKGMGADGSFVAINNRVSQSVPHLHVHIIPRREKDGLRGFFWPRQKYASIEETLEIQKRLQVTIKELAVKGPVRSSRK